MLKNNIEVDVKIKCIEAGKTQAQLGEMIGSTGQYVNRIILKFALCAHSKNTQDINPECRICFIPYSAFIEIRNY